MAKAISGTYTHLMVIKITTTPEMAFAISWTAAKNTCPNRNIARIHRDSHLNIVHGYRPSYCHFACSQHDIQLSVSFIGWNAPASAFEQSTPLHTPSCTAEN